jgi:type IV/VI secretion system ImpK/VasF family protein
MTNKMSHSGADNALRGAYHDLFLLAGWMQDGLVNNSRADALRAYAGEVLRKERHALLRAGVAEEICDEAQMAVIALLDESAQTSPERDFAERWLQSPLQHEYYHRSILGLDFFRRLEHRRSRSDTPLALLEFYLRCLAWNFQGYYRNQNQLDALRILRETLHSELRHRVGSPSPLPSPLVERTKLPSPLTTPAGWVLGISAGLILCCGALLSLLLYWQALDVTQALRSGHSGESDTKPAGSNRNR